MTTLIQHSASIGSTSWHWSKAFSLVLASLLLTACGGSDPSRVASIKADFLPPCGIEGSGARVQGCTGGPLLPPPPETDGASVCTPPPEGSSAPAGPLV